MLKMDENTLLKEAKDINLEKVQQAIKQVRVMETNNGSSVRNLKIRSRKDRGMVDLGGEGKDTF